MNREWVEKVLSDHQSAEQLMAQYHQGSLAVADAVHLLIPLVARQEKEILRLSRELSWVRGRLAGGTVENP